MRTEELLKQSQSLTQELQHQQQELQDKNQRLEEQARSLRESERLLKEQQEKLKGTNEDLEEKARLLAEQNAEVARKNNEIELARQELEEKAEQLALSSRYKSEFLANMSHELRTPLNSLLILSKLMSQNPEGNLTPQQIEYAGTIHSAGSDLLALINEILDLAKIESGTMELDIRNVSFNSVEEYVSRIFRPAAEQKGLEFRVELAGDLPPSITTDPQRLQQIIRNLLSNAMKFTEAGSVMLRVRRADSGWSRNNPALAQSQEVIAFDIIDTGIGIPAEKHRVIFEAFQQADGTTSRRYGGTGLGLSISREMAALLHGEITLNSEPGRGSTFTVYLPREIAAARASTTEPPRKKPRDTYPGEESQVDDSKAPSPQKSARAVSVGDRRTAIVEGNGEHEVLPLPPSPQIAPSLLGRSDDRSGIRPGDLTLLIIDDDPNFTGILKDRARQSGFKVIAAGDGESGLGLARDLKPSAILLDINLPGINGWAVLDRLKHDPQIRHIPVYILAVSPDHACSALKLGARKYVEKMAATEALDDLLQEMKAFIQRRQKSLLVVEDDQRQASSIADLVGGHDIAVQIVSNGEDALVAMKNNNFDCVVLDLGLPGLSGFEVVEQVRRDPQLAGSPIVVYTARDLTKSEQAQLNTAAEAVIVKGVHSPEQLLEQTALFLHVPEATLPPGKRKMIEQARLNDPALLGVRVLIVDDDVRNVFALTAALEQRFNMQVTYADNGLGGIDKLKNDDEINVVLMDVMMPGMDGYDTIRRIRKLPGRENIPIIALTAKAMKGDREKCIAAGASDYIAKPVDTDQLASLIRVWVGDARCVREKAQ
jgi:signal transduction histidine kinase/DNA-binding response OmpR family regulator